VEVEVVVVALRRLPGHGHLFMEPHLQMVGVGHVVLVQPTLALQDALDEGDLGRRRKGVAGVAPVPRSSWSTAYAGGKETSKATKKNKTIRLKGTTSNGLFVHEIIFTLNTASYEPDKPIQISYRTKKHLDYSIK